MINEPPVILDFESRSRADLDAVGGRNYWAHPSTEPICAAWYDTRDGSAGMWLPGDAWPHHGRLLGAHNATGFDRHGAVRLKWMTSADEWVDTSELARTAGLPGALDALGKRWLDLSKDKDASRFTRGLSRARRPKHLKPDEWRAMSEETRQSLGELPELTPAALDRVTGYCASDVEILAVGWESLDDWRALEPDVVAVDRAINDRGVPLDVDLCRALLLADEANSERVVTRVSEDTGLGVDELRAIASSPAQFCSATGAPNAQKGTVENLDHPLAEVRRTIASIARGKLEAGLARVSSDGRLRDSHLYYGGHTGRFAGKGMQLQNLPRPAKQFEKKWEAELLDDAGISDWLGACASRVASTGEATPAEIGLLLRGVIAASPGKTLAVCDFSGVEARALAWAAGDHKALDVFVSGRDPYKVAAATIFGVPYESVTDAMRRVGKTAELACGYGQGGKKFADTSAKMGADLAAVGVDPFAVVASWRKLHAPSVRLWHNVEAAFRRAIEGRDSAEACFEFRRASKGDDVAVFLPSGRPIVYCNARFDGTTRRGIIFEGGRVDDTSSKPSPFCPVCWCPCVASVAGRAKVYRCKAHGNVVPAMRVRTYGGKLVENLIQALCRDLLTGSLVASERSGLCPVMHVHDEIVCEVDRSAGAEGYHELRQIMRSAPDWAAGFPLDAKGFVCGRYRK